MADYDCGGLGCGVQPCICEFPGTMKRISKIVPPREPDYHVNYMVEDGYEEDDMPIAMADGKLRP